MLLQKIYSMWNLLFGVGSRLDFIIHSSPQRFSIKWFWRLSLVQCQPNTLAVGPALCHRPLTEGKRDSCFSHGKPHSLSLLLIFPFHFILFVKSTDLSSLLCHLHLPHIVHCHIVHCPTPHPRHFSFISARPRRPLAVSPSCCPFHNFSLSLSRPPLTVILRVWLCHDNPKPQPGLHPCCPLLHAACAAAAEAAVAAATAPASAACMHVRYVLPHRNFSFRTSLLSLSPSLSSSPSPPPGWLIPSSFTCIRPFS